MDYPFVFAATPFSYYGGSLDPPFMVALGSRQLGQQEVQVVAEFWSPLVVCVCVESVMTSISHVPCIPLQNAPRVLPS